MIFVSAGFNLPFIASEVTYDYYQHNRLTLVKDDESNMIHYMYDAAGNRTNWIGAIKHGSLGFLTGLVAPDPATAYSFGAASSVGLGALELSVGSAERVIKGQPLFMEWSSTAAERKIGHAGQGRQDK